MMMSGKKWCRFTFVSLLPDWLLLRSPGDSSECVLGPRCSMARFSRRVYSTFAVSFMPLWQPWRGALRHPWMLYPPIKWHIIVKATNIFFSPCTLAKFSPLYTSPGSHYCWDGKGTYILYLNKHLCENASVKVDELILFFSLYNCFYFVLSSFLSLFLSKANFTP